MEELAARNEPAAETPLLGVEIYSTFAMVDMCRSIGSVKLWDGSNVYKNQGLDVQLTVVREGRQARAAFNLDLGSVLLEHPRLKSDFPPGMMVYVNSNNLSQGDAIATAKFWIKEGIRQGRLNPKDAPEGSEESWEQLSLPVSART